MTYNKCTLSIFFSVLIGFTTINAQSRDLDSVYYIKINPFLGHLIEFHDLETNVIQSHESQLIPVKGTVFESMGQEILKDKDKLYINIEQTGILFQFTGKQDSFAIFKRIDHTININYNIGCLTFMSQNQIYNFGGYGFWRSNGHLRRFSFIDKEWDIIPLNTEIFSDGFMWFSKNENRLYVPFQKKMNAGIMGGGDINDSEKFATHYLDINTKSWIKIGELTSKTTNLLNGNSGGSGYLQVKNGIIHIINDEIYYFDFIENKIYRSVRADYNQFYIRRIYMKDMYYYKDKIYFYNFSTQRFDVIPFSLNDFKSLDFAIWGRDKSYDIFIEAIFIIAASIIFVVWLIQKKFKATNIQSQLTLLKNKSANQAFVGSELALIDLLLSAALKESKVEIFQINHVLGIKDKNLGLQKKVRSDIINAVNDKYQFITQSGIPLISSVRREDDKRFFEYFISGTEIKNIQRILEK